MALDFTTAVLDARVTVTRALNTATRVDANGLVAVVNANLPRFDYDPITKVCRGLLIEEARTNLLPYSEDFTNLIWSKVGVTATADATVSPDGTTDADKLVETATVGVHYTRQTPIIVSSGSAVAITVYAKAGERQYIALLEGYSNKGRYFDLVNGTLGGVFVGAPTTSTITPVGNGWYRCSITTTAPATTVDAEIYISPDGTSTSYSGVAGNGVFLWGAQLEAGAFATSYIPTTTTSLTRNADAVSMTGTNFSSWYNQTQGTFVTSADAISTGANRVIVGGGVLTYLNYIRSNNQGGAFDTTNLAATANVITTDVFKLATTYGNSALQACLNGGTVASGAYNNIFASLTSIGIGNSASGAFLNGHVRTVNYYPQRLIGAELQAFSK
jgi:hypothetical protein